MKPRLELVAAAAENGSIGHGGGLPWGRVPVDRLWFAALTLGKPVIMGRKTHQSVGRSLKGRTNVVLSRGENDCDCGCVRVSCVDAALAVVGGAPVAAVVGGGEIYRLFMPLVSAAYITVVKGDFPGDTFLPPIPNRLSLRWSFWMPPSETTAGRNLRFEWYDSPVLRGSD